MGEVQHAVRMECTESDPYTLVIGIAQTRIISLSRFVLTLF